jgi:hypothetical protein
MSGRGRRYGNGHRRAGKRVRRLQTQAQVRGDRYRHDAPLPQDAGGTDDWDGEERVARERREENR